MSGDVSLSSRRFFPDRAYLAPANGTVIAQSASDSETTEVAESDGGVHPHLGRREPCARSSGAAPTILRRLAPGATA